MSFFRSALSLSVPNPTLCRNCGKTLRDHRLDVATSNRFHQCPLNVAEALRNRNHNEENKMTIVASKETLRTQLQQAVTMCLQQGLIHAADFLEEAIYTKETEL
jgi:hypothetical protein